MKTEDLPELPPNYRWATDESRYYIKYEPDNEEYVTILTEESPVEIIYWGQGMRRRWQDKVDTLESAVGIVAGRLWLGEWT